MASLKERNGNYSIRFVQTFDGKRKSAQFSLHTNRKKVAEKHKRRLELEYEQGDINLFDNNSVLNVIKKERKNFVYLKCIFELHNTKETFSL